MVLLIITENTEKCWKILNNTEKYWQLLKNAEKYWKILKNTDDTDKYWKYWTSLIIWLGQGSVNDIGYGFGHRGCI